MRTKGQLNAQARLKTAPQAPSFSVAPYLLPEIYAGDAITYVNGTNTLGYPSGTLSETKVLLAGINQGTAYTTTDADAHKVLQISQSASSADFPSPVTAVSAAVTILVRRTYGSMGLKGVNIGAPVEYGQMRLFQNMFLEGRGFAAQGAGYPILQGVATASFSAASGSGVTMTLSTPCSSLSGNSTDVGRIFVPGANGAYATVTSFTDATHATVTITGTLSSTSFTSTNWYVTIPVDSNGFPLIASMIYITAAPFGGGEGQMAAGTYLVSYDSSGGSVNMTATITGGTGGTLSGPVTSGSRRTYTLTKNALANPLTDTDCNIALFFDGAITNPDCPRDGSAVSTSVFNPIAIAYYAQFDGARTMDFLNVIYRTDATAANIPPDRVMPWHAVPWSGGGQQVMQYQYAIQMVNAIAAWPGSKLKWWHLTLPHNIDPGYSAYVSNLLITYAPTGAVATGAVQMYVEPDNEAWDFNRQAYYTYQNLAETDAQVIGFVQYANQNSYISSVVQAGTTVTVNLSVTVAQLNSLLGVNLTANVTTFAVAYVDDASWNIVPSASAPTHVATITSVSTSSFQYTAPDSKSVTLNSVKTTYGIFFNLASPLLTPYLNWNVFKLTNLWHVKHAYQVQQAWTRSQDRFLLGVKFGEASTNVNGANNLVNPAFAYSSFVGGGSASWLYGTCGAPYVGGNFHVTANGTTAFTAPAGFMAVGDTVTIGGVTTTVTGAADTNYTVAATLGSGALKGAITSNTASGAGQRVLAAMIANVSTGGDIDQQMRVHIFAALYLGLVPCFYEGGPDLAQGTQQPNLQTSIQTDPMMGTFITALLDCCFKNGGSIYSHYFGSPQVFTNSTTGAWGLCQSYSDTTSPKIAAFLGYATPYWPANQSGSPGTLFSTQCQQYSAGGFGSGAGSANYKFNSYTVDNYVDYLTTIPRAGRYKLVPNATDSVRGDPSILTQAEMMVDPVYGATNASAGTFAVPANGAGASSAAQACAGVPYSFSKSGAHIVRIFLPAGAGVATGFSGVSPVPY